MKPLQQKTTRAENRNILLSQSASRWEETIREILQRLAGSTWQRKTALGVLPIRSYRYRRSASAARYLWWVEHDLQGFNRFFCEAFIVEMVWSEKNQTEFRLYTREGIYPLNFTNHAELIDALATAAQDHPKRIPRRRGVARGD